MHRQAAEGSRVLVCAPFGRDAESVAQLLRRDGYEAETCGDVEAVARRVSTGRGEDVGAVVLTEEALRFGISPLAEALKDQPDWSDIPFVLLAARRSGQMDAASRLRNRLPPDVLNVVVLERPLSTESLVSSVASVMRARQKQFEMRDRLGELTAGREALAASERELRLVADSIPVLIAFVDRSLTYRFANRAYEDWFGIGPERVIGRTIPEILGPEAFETRREGVAMALAGEPFRMETALRDPGGARAERDAEIRYLPRRDGRGEVDGFHIFVLDITEAKRMEGELREAAAQLEARVAERTQALSAEMTRRASAEDALRQSQKMEAIGQLTGGIAHDFNNMLAGVVGSLDLMRRRIDRGDYAALERYISNAMQAAQRAATLTARLLAFGRRQSLDLKPVDLNAIVRGMEDLLRRTLGENVRIRVDLDPTSLSARTDVSQLENSLLNLAINARDAMPEGGELTIATRRAAPGEHEGKRGEFLVLSVADTGTGMSPETLAKAFEPFFTTKPIGQGTGLGLSQIYGFAQQSGGHVAIESEEGRGTVIRLVLPMEAATAPADEAADRSAPAGEGESVLVVEDEGLVRMLIVDVLADLGYHPIEADGAERALPVLESGERIDLLVTDVGLPGMNGRQLAEVARRLRPDLKILFVTGYAEQASVRGEFLGEGMDLIGKPFDYDALGAKIREMIAGRTEA